MPIVILLIAHWYTAIFFQSFFLHRYATHQMFTMNQFWVKVFYVLTFLSQGLFCFNPKTYAIMHRMHHANTDTEKDPHSPVFYRGPWAVALQMSRVFLRIYHRKVPIESWMQKGCPEWSFFDRWVDRLPLRTLLCGFYVGYYLHFATSPWMYLLLPLHFFMGIIVGLVVNLGGHQHGYTNYKVGNESKNMAPIDLITLGELLHNNHHAFPSRPNFSVRWFEVDLIYIFLKVFKFAGVVRFSNDSAK